MKRSLFRLFNLFMTCVVLLSSTGFGLVERTCQMRGKKKMMVVAFSDAKMQKGCADGKQSQPSKQTVIKKTECCQDDQRYENVDVTSSLSQLIAKFVKSIAETVLTGVSIMLTWLNPLGFLPVSRHHCRWLSILLLPPGVTFSRSLIACLFDSLIDYRVPVSLQTRAFVVFI